MTTFTKDELGIAVRAERHRHQLVLASAEFRGREAAALHMLSESDLDSAAIIAALSGIAAGQPQNPSEQQGDFARGQQIASRLPQALRK